MSNTNAGPKRLMIVDALRGFALFGILQLHAIEHFDFYFFPDLGPPFLKMLDKGVWDTLFFIFGGKSFAMFAMMFGLSFYIQMESRRQKNENFRWRFLWRLFILLVIGILNGFLYDGDVLRFLAVFGVLLIIFYSLSDTVLIVLSFLFLLNLPRIWQLYQSFTVPDFKLPETPMNQLFGALGNVYANGSFKEVALANAWTGLKAGCYFYLESGRYMQIPGLFIWGLLLGRSHFFHNINDKQKILVRIIVISFVSFAVFITLKYGIPNMGMSTSSQEIASALATNYLNTSFMVFLAAGFVWLCTQRKGKFLEHLLSPYGRMSLTNYVTMGIVLIPFFYGYGLAMYKYCGATVCLFIGLSFFALQLWFSHVWLRHYYYGPLEWVWRCLTFLSFDMPFKRKKISTEIA